MSSFQLKEEVLTLSMVKSAVSILSPSPGPSKQLTPSTNLHWVPGKKQYSGIGHNQFNHRWCPKPLRQAGNSTSNWGVAHPLFFTTWMVLMNKVEAQRDSGMLIDLCPIHSILDLNLIFKWILLCTEILLLLLAYKTWTVFASRGSNSRPRNGYDRLPRGADVCGKCDVDLLKFISN